MKIIKFRGWNPRTKQMLTDFNDCLMGFENDNSFNIVELKEYGTHEDYQVLTLMQFTGLHDRNGQEVYEGDIYKYDNMNYGYGDPKEPEDLIGTIESIEELYKDEYLILRIQNCEVIGNIYQNLELNK